MNAAGPLSVICLLGVDLLGSGCRTMNLPPADLAATGWETQETAAVWRPRAAAPELAGELLVAHHSNGSQFVQFSKQGLPLVTARTTTNAWEITSSLRAHGWSRPMGSTGPPDRVLWFQLRELPPHPGSHSRWQRQTEPDGAWKLLNPLTGETLIGVALP